MVILGSCHSVVLTHKEAKFNKAHCASASSTLLGNIAVRQSRGVRNMARVVMEQRVVVYPSKQGIPSAILRCLASLIMHENSEPLFRRKEVKGCELAPSRAAWGELVGSNGEF